MIATLLLSLATPAPTHPVASAFVAPAPGAAEARRQDEEYDAKLAEAGDDVTKLWELHLWCKETSRNSESRATLKKLLELDAEHAEAHKALGHHSYDGQWFETYTALAKYKRAEEKRMRDQGLARYKDEWVKIDDLPYLRMSWVQGDDGKWRSPHEIARREQEEKYRADGWIQKDMIWISPEEAPNLEKGLYKCGEDWLSLEEADTFHAQIGQWWRRHEQHFIVNSTLPFAWTDWARFFADSTFQDLTRIFGIVPEGPIEVTVLNSLGQYNQLAGGDPNQGIPGFEASGFSSCHYAFFAELFIDPSVQPMEYRGQGVGYWDVNDPKVKPYGPMAIRHAAALSFAEVIDPSLDTVSRFIENPSGQPNAPAFWNEKRIPNWLRFGSASYVDRFRAEEHDVNNVTWAARDWSIGQMKEAGGLLPFEQIFGLTLDPADPEGTARRMSQAGLFVAFMLDANCAPVVEKHSKLKSVLKSGEDVTEALTELQTAITENLAALTAFSGLEMAPPPAAPAEAASPAGAAAAGSGTDAGGTDDGGGGEGTGESSGGR